MVRLSQISDVMRVHVIGVRIFHVLVLLNQGQFLMSLLCWYAFCLPLVCFVVPLSFFSKIFYILHIQFNMTFI